MAIAHDYPPAAGTDRHLVARRQADVADRDRADDRGEAAPTFLRLGFDPRLVPAGQTPMYQRFRRRLVANVGGQHPGEQPFAPAHPQTYPELVRKPAGKTNMVRMEMGANDPADIAVGKRSSK